MINMMIRGVFSYDYNNKNSIMFLLLLCVFMRLQIGVSLEEEGGVHVTKCGNDKDSENNEVVCDYFDYYHQENLSTDNNIMMLSLSSLSLSSSSPTLRTTECIIQATDSDENEKSEQKQYPQSSSVLRLPSGLLTDFHMEDILVIVRLNCDDDNRDDEDPSNSDITKNKSSCYERFMSDHISALSPPGKFVFEQQKQKQKQEKTKEEDPNYNEGMVWSAKNVLGLCDSSNKENKIFENHRNSPSMVIRLSNDDNKNNIFNDVGISSSSSNTEQQQQQQQQQQDICFQNLSSGHYVVAIVNCRKNPLPPPSPPPPQQQQQQRHRSVMNGQVTGALDWSDNQNDTTIPSGNEDSNDDEEEEENTTIVNNYTDDYSDVQEEEIESKYFGSKYHLMVLMTLIVCIYLLWRYMKRRERARWQEYHTLQLLQQQDEAFDVTLDDEEEDAELFGYHDSKKNSDLELVESPSSLGGKR